jgi:YidC/Oxa1 family membrane protein insertase
MEKRIFLAIVISIGFLFLWGAIAPKLFPELAKKPVPPKSSTSTAATSTTSTTTAPKTPSAPAASVAQTAAAPSAPVAASRVELTTVDAPEYTAVFSNRGAQLVSFKLKAYTGRIDGRELELVKARAANRTDYPFSIVAADRPFADRLNSALYALRDRTDRGHRILEYRYSDGHVTAIKTFTFTEEQPFLFGFATKVAPAIPYRVAIGPGIRTLGPDEQDSRMVMTGNGVVERGGKFKILSREKGQRVQIFDNVQYIGVEDNYFMTVLRPTRGGDGVLSRVSFFDEKKTQRDDLYAAVNAAGGVVAGDAFFGPKETKILDRYNMEDALQFGMFGLIARFFLKALLWINQFTKNYGFAIIVLTILIKIVLFPVQHKQNVSMKKMQKAQPKIDAIKAKYKKAKTDAEQRNKMNMEMMQLYQKEGINPMAGCLPLVIQFPIMLGFYNLLSHAIELRGAPFMLWIHDLSAKDPYYITPILMTISMFIQTYMMPATGDPAQRKMFLVMPLVFGFFFKDFASGLVLYWLVQNILTILQQWIMNRWWKNHPSELQTA